MTARALPVLALSFAAGSVPSTQIAARMHARVDLRDVGSGTVSGTSLYRVAGFAPLAISGIADIAKATIGPALAGRDRPTLAALAGAAAIAVGRASARARAPFRVPRRQRARIASRARRRCRAGPHRDALASRPTQWRAVARRRTPRGGGRCGARTPRAGTRRGRADDGLYRDVRDGDGDAYRPGPDRAGVALGTRRLTVSARISSIMPESSAS